MEDTEIIGLYVSRRESAIGETAKKYGSYLNQVAYNILRCREDTEEVVEDTYLAAWNTIPPTMPKVLKHFLSRIARNLSFDRLDYRTAKRRGGEMVGLLSELDECLPDSRGSLEEQYEARQIGVVLNRFLAEQSHGDCALFLSRYYYAMTVKEIGAKYGLKERTVAYRLSRLRKDLRKELEREEIAL